MILLSVLTVIEVADVTYFTFVWYHLVYKLCLLGELRTIQLILFNQKIMSVIKGNKMLLRGLVNIKKR